jgi:MarR family transcriptional regulator, organic hydroperoxide resistance regulator
MTQDRAEIGWPVWRNPANIAAGAGATCWPGTPIALPPACYRSAASAQRKPIGVRQLSKPSQRAVRASERSKRAGAVPADGRAKRARKPLAELLGEQRVAGLHIDLRSMALVSNIHRASGIIREHFERCVLEDADLHWSAFVTLWCLWIYGDLETRRLALEAGVAKSTLSSILNMLESRRLVRRRTNELERRLVIVNLTAAGVEMISGLFPKFNAEETRIVARLSAKQMKAATEAIRVILGTIADLDAPAEGADDGG